MGKDKNKMIGIAGEDLSAGCLVYVSGHKWAYTGKLFKPWTWLSFKKTPIIKSTFDHNIKVDLI